MLSLRRRRESITASGPAVPAKPVEARIIVHNPNDYLTSERRRLTAGHFLIETSGPRPAKNSLVASAEILSDPGSVARQLRLRQLWQTEAWGYYDAVGEFHYSARYVANAFSRIRFRPGWRGDDDQVGPIMSNMDPAIIAQGQLAAQLLTNMRAKSGGQAAINYMLGLNLSVAAECYLVATDTYRAGKVSQRRWEVLSTDELRPTMDGVNWTRYMGPGLPPIPLPANSFPVRIWLKHGRYSQMADGQIRPMLDLLEELVLLTREVRGQTLSRLAGPGILLIPQGVTWPDDPQEGESQAGNPVARALVDAVMRPIFDKGAASGYAPVVFEVPDEKAKDFVHIDFRTPNDALSVTKRTEAVQRFAQGSDLPVEIVTGHQNTTYANAGKIDEGTYKAHIEPLALQAGDAQCEGYLTPMLMAMNGLDPRSEVPELIERICIWPDATNALAPPDRSKEAEVGHGIFALSDASWRRENGFSENDAPTEEEIEARVLRQQRLNSREMIRAEEQDPPSVSLIQPSPDVKNVPVVVASAADPMDLLAAQVAAAGDLAIERVASWAGARLRTKASKEGGAVTVLASMTTNDRLTARLPLALVEPVESLVPGQLEDFGRLCGRLLAENGVSDPAVVTRCIQAVQLAAVARLYDPGVRLSVTALRGYLPPAPTA